MDFQVLINRANQVRAKYSELERRNYGREWTREEIAQGFVGDVGDLMKLVMSKSGIRGSSQVDDKLAHELSDCLWCILVLAQKYDINLESTFMKSMDELETKITGT